MSSVAELRNKQHEDWELIAQGWRKWDEQLMEWLRPVGEKMIDLAGIEDGNIVLDVATGSGEPGLSAAKRTGKKGKVIGVDLSEEMVDIARGKAKNLGIKNYEAHVYSSSDLPFDSNYFDAVLCRFGIMFFPDVLQGLKEMARVLKPNRSLCVAVWGPQNERIKSVMQILVNKLGLPQLSPDTPNPYRCSEPGKITSLMEQSGLSYVKQVELTARRIHSSTGQFWEYLVDLNPLIANAFNKANEETKKETKLKVTESLDSIKGKNGELSFDTIAWINQGIK